MLPHRSTIFAADGIQKIPTAMLSALRIYLIDCLPILTFGYSGSISITIVPRTIPFSICCISSSLDIVANFISTWKNNLLDRIRHIGIHIIA